MSAYGVKIKGTGGTIVYSVNAQNPQEALQVGRERGHGDGLRGAIRASIVVDPLSLRIWPLPADGFTEADYRPKWARDRLKGSAGD